MNIQRLFIKKQNQNVKTTIKEIKMYNSQFSYKGYGLMAQKNEIPNSCVPSYILKLYNNEEETNPRKRLKKLTMDQVSFL